MNWQNIATVYLKELKDSLRDRRTLISTIVVPTLVMPLMFFGVGKVMSKTISKARRGHPDGRGARRRTVRRHWCGSCGTRRGCGWWRRRSDWKRAISDKTLRVAVELPERFEARLEAGELPPVRIYFYEGELKSDNGARVLERFLAEYREQVVVTRLAAHGLPRSAARPFEYRRENVAPPEKVGGNLFGGIVPYLIIILCFTGRDVPGDGSHGGGEGAGHDGDAALQPGAAGGHRDG
jgi:sodium transport system permease protein